MFCTAIGTSRELININYANPLSHSTNCDILLSLPLFSSSRRLATRPERGGSSRSAPSRRDCDYSRRLCLQLAAQTTRLLLLLLLLVTNAAPYGGTMTHIMRRFY